MKYAAHAEALAPAARTFNTAVEKTILTQPVGEVILSRITTPEAHLLSTLGARENGFGPSGGTALDAVTRAEIFATAMQRDPLAARTGKKLVRAAGLDTMQNARSADIAAPAFAKFIR